MNVYFAYELLWVVRASLTAAGFEMGRGKMQKTSIGTDAPVSPLVLKRRTEILRVIRKPGRAAIGAFQLA
jgi:hypothetical protein